MLSPKFPPKFQPRLRHERLEQLSNSSKHELFSSKCSKKYPRKKKSIKLINICLVHQEKQSSKIYLEYW